MGAIHLEGLLSGPPGSLPGLVAVGSSETGPGFRTVDWAGLLAPSHPSPAGSESPCLLPPDHARVGSCDTFSQLPRKHSEAAMLTHRSRCVPTSPAGQGFAPIIYCQGGAHWDSWLHWGAE